MRKIIVSLLMAASLIACVPIAYSLAAGVAGWPTVSDGGATAGAVVVTACPSPVRPCQGMFGYADPGGAAGGQPSGVSYSVPIANDLRRHRTGTVVAASLDASHRRAYLSGGRPVLLILASVLVVAFVLTCAVMVGHWLVAGQPVAYAGPVAAVVVALMLAVGLVAPLGDHGWPASPPNAPAPVRLGP